MEYHSQSHFIHTSFALHSHFIHSTSESFRLSFRFLKLSLHSHSLCHNSGTKRLPHVIAIKCNSFVSLGGPRDAKLFNFIAITWDSIFVPRDRKRFTCATNIIKGVCGDEPHPEHSCLFVTKVVEQKCVSFVESTKERFREVRKSFTVGGGTYAPGKIIGIMFLPPLAK